MITAEQARALAPKEDCAAVDEEVQRILEQVKEAASLGLTKVSLIRPAEAIEDFVASRLDELGYVIEHDNYICWIIDWSPLKIIDLRDPPSKSWWSRLWSRD